MAKIIDLTKPVKHYPEEPFFMKVRIKHSSHKFGRHIVRLLGLPYGRFPRDFTGWADDK